MRLYKISILIMKNITIFNNKILASIAFFIVTYFLKIAFNNILNIFNVDCNFNKEKIRNLKKEEKSVS